MRKKVFDASHKLRASSFGQDRYRRRYWALPTCGGIYLESLESAELPDDKSDITDTNIAEQKHVKSELNELAPYTKADDNVRGKAEHTIRSTQDMEIDHELGKLATRTVFGCEQESKDDKKTFSIEGIISAIHRSRDTAISSVGTVKTECPSVPNTSVSNSSTCRDNSLLASPRGIDSSLFLHQTPPLLHRGDESCDLRAHSSCNGGTFRSISSILSTPDSSLPTDMSMMSPSFGASPHTLSASTPISLSSYVEPGSWFSVLPRTSCDPTEKRPSGGATSAVLKSSSSHLHLSDSLSTFHLRQSNASPSLFNSVHNVTAGSDMSSSLLHRVTGDGISDASQIAAQVEAMLVRDQVQYVESKPIPESTYPFSLSFFCMP